jgi:hypothetical protein
MNTDLIKKTQFEKDVPFWILSAIVDELKRAEQKHPHWPTDIIHAAAIVGEESGELTRSALQAHYEKGNMDNCQVEAIQVAVTAIRFLKEKYLQP